MNLPLDEINERLAGLSEAQKKRVVADAIKATKAMRWVPNPGPQTLAYNSAADELFFGGSAGGGKSDLAIGLALNKHTKALILREYNEDARSLGGRLMEILGGTEGWNGQILRYQDKNITIEFGGCKAEEDKQRYKGDPHDLLCVGIDTPVLMGDGGWKPVQDICVSDVVMTLEGARKVTKAFATPIKKSIKLTAVSDDGVIYQQIQSASHKVLTREGWVALGIQAFFSQGSPFYDASSVSNATQKAFSIQTALFSLSRKARQGLVVLWRNVLTPLLTDFPWLYQKDQPALTSYKAAVIHNDDYVKYYDLPQDVSPLPLYCRTEAAHLKRFSCLNALPSSCSFLLYGVFDALKKSVFQGFLLGYRFLSHFYGERIPESSDHRHELTAYQEYLLQQGGVGQRNPISLLPDVMGKAPRHSRRIMSYDHPYTKDKRQSYQHVSYASWTVTPVEDQVLYDLEIEEVNHFITYGGIVNKNCFDEVGDFTETQYTFISAWNRSTKKGQRSRILATGNPPTRAKGLWVIERWAAWLNPNHPNPAQDGELRWYLMDEEGREREVDGPGPHQVGREMIRARSRSFIRAKLSDNPDLAATDYDANLAALPLELRLAYREGRFDMSLKDVPNQIIPTDWVRQAQQRWTKQKPKDVPQCVMGVDMSGGGDDPMIIASRYDGWYDELIEIPGKSLPMESLGRTAAGHVIANRRNNSLVVVDMGGGYGGSLYEHLKENLIPASAYKGAEACAKRSRDGKLRFANKRSAALWLFREALDPGQNGGSPIMLPDDPKLVADLTTPTFEMGANGIKAQSKEDVVSKLGRSPDRGDAVVMAWFEGAKQSNSALEWIEKKINSLPKVIMGRHNAR